MPDSNGPPSDARVDPTAFSTLRALEASSPGFLRQILEDFTEAFDSRLSDGVRAVQAGDAAGLAVAVHSLRGNSAIIGARGIVSLCARVEADARQGRLAGARQLLVHIGDEYRGVADFLRAEVAELGRATQLSSRERSGPSLL